MWMAQSIEGPHESTFSCVFAQLVRLNVAKQIHGAMIETHLGAELVEHASPCRLCHQGKGTGLKTCPEGEGSAPKKRAEEKGRGLSGDCPQPERASGFVSVCPDASRTDPESLAPRV